VQANGWQRSEDSFVQANGWQRSEDSLCKPMVGKEGLKEGFFL
jgi:hypothetical protein